VRASGYGEGYSGLLTFAASDDHDAARGARRGSFAMATFISAMFALMLFSARHDSATFEEVEYIWFWMYNPTGILAHP
jgi:hypothetical protein